MFLKRKKKTFSQFWFIRAYTLMKIYFAVILLLKSIMNYVIVIFVIRKCLGLVNIYLNITSHSLFSKTVCYSRAVSGLFTDEVDGII